MSVHPSRPGDKVAVALALATLVGNPDFHALDVDAAGNGG